MSNDQKLTSLKESIEENIQNTLMQQITTSFSSQYLTLISIIQGVALGYCATVAIPKLFEKSRSITFTFTIIMLVATSFLAIIAIWNEYRMTTSVVVWAPTLKDSFIPFSLGIFEFLNIYTLQTNISFWFLSMAIGYSIGIYGFYNVHQSVRKEKSNNLTLKQLTNDFFEKLTYWFCILASVISLMFFIVLILSKNQEGRMLSFSILSFIIGVLFVLRGDLWWFRFIYFAETGELLLYTSNEKINSVKKVYRYLCRLINKRIASCYTWIK